MLTSRSQQPELMDDPAVDPDTLRHTLDDLARINALLGGHPPSIDAISRLAQGADTLSILDVGTGAADIPRQLVHWAAEHNIEITIDGIDLSPIAAEHARQRCADFPQIRVEHGDLFDVSGSRRFDVVHAALMLHHLDDPRAREGLRRMYELSRLGVVLNDLHRHVVGYLGSHLVLRLLSKNRLIRHDGPLSIRRGFRRRDIEALARDAGLPVPDIRWRPFFRWQVILHRRET